MHIGLNLGNFFVIFLRATTFLDNVMRWLVSELFAGKPACHSTFTRKQLKSWINTKRGGLLQQWVYRNCVISGTRLLLYKGQARILFRSVMSMYILFLVHLRTYDYIPVYYAVSPRKPHYALHLSVRMSVCPSVCLVFVSFTWACQHTTVPMCCGNSTDLEGCILYRCSAIHSYLVYFKHLLNY